MSGGGGSQTQSTEPWSGQKTPLKRVYNRAEDAFDQGEWQTYGEATPGQRQNYVNETLGIDAKNAAQLAGMGLDPNATKTAIRTGGFTPFTAAEQQAQQGAMQLAGAGVDPSLYGAQDALQNNAGLAMLGQTNPALDYLNQGASGQYLTADSNPYLSSAVQAARDPLIQDFNTRVLPAVTSQFGAGGAFGSGAHQFAVQNATNDLSTNLANAATNAYAQNYGQERQNQLASQQALGSLSLGQGQALTEGVQRNAALMPGMAEAIRGQQMGNLSLLEGVGGAQADKAAQLGSMQADPYLQQQKAYDDMVARYAALVQGQPSFQSQTSSGGGTNRTAGALGGAATGAAMGSVAGPWGAAAGGLIGGLGGAFL